MIYSLNCINFNFNDSTGEVISITTQNGREIVMHCGGLFDIAIPIKYDYEILRMTPNDKNADAVQFSYSQDKLIVEYRTLGINIPKLSDTNIPQISDGVYAKLEMIALDNRKSVSIKLHLRNNCDATIKQIIFPDFSGIVPVTSAAATRFTTLGFNSIPFIELKDTPEKRRGWFAVNPIICGKIYKSGGYFSEENMIGRYYDLGSLQGGYSLFPKWWGYGPDNYQTMCEEVLVKYNQETDKLRIGNIHSVDIPKGGEYTSCEYIFTPHTGGWVNGIGPYKEWVTQNKKRVVNPPSKVTEAIGYRTIWMKEQYPKDEEAIAYYYDDLPKVAEDMLEHGLSELSIWGESDFNLPYSEHSYIPELGGYARWLDNVHKVAKMGVAVVPFVSFVSIWRDSCARYGLAIEDTSTGWSQNLKGIPNFQSPYMERYCCCMVNQTNELWKKDVMESLRFLRDIVGTPSIGWDQYIDSNIKGGVADIIYAYRMETMEMYPNATFSSESTYNFESDISVLDYTWDWEYWPGIGDCRPYINVVGTTRPNINIDNNSLHVKYCFMDNILMNIFPSKSGKINGSAYIYEYPLLSQMLKKAAIYKKRYIDYFTLGCIIGDCLLVNDPTNAYVTAYALESTILVLIMATSDDDVLLCSDQFNGEILQVVCFDTDISVDILTEHHTLEFACKKDYLYITQIKRVESDLF